MKEGQTEGRKLEKKKKGRMEEGGEKKNSRELIWKNGLNCKHKYLFIMSHTPSVQLSNLVTGLVTLVYI